MRTTCFELGQANNIDIDRTILTRSTCLEASINLQTCKLCVSAQPTQQTIWHASGAIPVALPRTAVGLF